jgi:DNA-directed RNA polymerase specialized sigma24 family protein
MTNLAQEIVEALPCLRRYTHALTGDRRRGDRYVGVALAVLAEEPWHVRPGRDVRGQLYRLVHRVLDALYVSEPAQAIDLAGASPRQALLARLQALPLAWRKLVLLTTVERLSLSRAAALVELPPREARTQLARARRALADLPAQAQLSRRTESFRPWQSESAHA